MWRLHLKTSSVLLPLHQHLSHRFCSFTLTYLSSSMCWRHSRYFVCLSMLLTWWSLWLSSSTQGSTSSRCCTHFKVTSRVVTSGKSNTDTGVYIWKDLPLCNSLRYLKYLTSAKSIYCTSTEHKTLRGKLSSPKKKFKTPVLSFHLYS